MAEVLSSYEKNISEQDIPAGKKKVLLAAIHLFAQRGFSATTTAQIAKEAGVSEGTIYKYFTSKKDLLTNLMMPLLTHIRDNFFANLDLTASLDQLVNRIIENRLAFAKNNIDLIKILLQEMLTKNDFGKTFQSLAAGDNGLLAKVAKLQAAYPEINPHLSSPQIIRIFVGPLTAYIGQAELFGIEMDQEADLQLIHEQIMAGLTTRI